VDTVTVVRTINQNSREPARLASLKMDAVQLLGCRPHSHVVFLDLGVVLLIPLIIIVHIAAIIVHIAAIVLHIAAIVLHIAATLLHIAATLLHIAATLLFSPCCFILLVIICIFGKLFAKKQHLFGIHQ
jgi:hypothetical protein